MKKEVTKVIQNQKDTKSNQTTETKKIITCRMCG